MSLKLALFFTENLSLKTWHDEGILKRDSLLYEKLAEQGIESYFVTYGQSDDLRYLPPDSKIKVLHRPDGMDLRHYSWNIHRIHRESLQKINIIKSHQVNGGRFALWAKWQLGNKPYIARCGYLPSVFLKNEDATRSRRLRNALEEALIFNSADAICVPSQAEISYLKQRYHIKGRKAYACPNWIDTQHFAPNPAIQANPRQICFIGRFQQQKAPLDLIEALKDIPNTHLLMIGGGALESQIKEKIKAYGIKATILGRVANEDLPRYLQESALYALPTRYEGGSPKTLFEAMACALPVISTDAFGVDSAFEHEKHGLKIPVGDVPTLRQAILSLLDDPQKARKLGTAGRQHILDHYAIERALEREIHILESLRR